MKKPMGIWAIVTAIVLLGASAASAETRVTVSYQPQGGPCWNAVTGSTYQAQFKVQAAEGSADLYGNCGVGSASPFETHITGTSFTLPPDSASGLQPGQSASLNDDQPELKRRFYVSVSNTGIPGAVNPSAGAFSYQVTLSDSGGGQRVLSGALAPGECALLGSTPAGGTATQDGKACSYAAESVANKKKKKKCKKKGKAARPGRKGGKKASTTAFRSGRKACKKKGKAIRPGR